MYESTRTSRLADSGTPAAVKITPTQQIGDAVTTTHGVQ